MSYKGDFQIMSGYYISQEYYFSVREILFYLSGILSFLCQGFYHFSVRDTTISLSGILSFLSVRDIIACKNNHNISESSIRDTIQHKWSEISDTIAYSGWSMEYRKLVFKLKMTTMSATSHPLTMDNIIWCWHGNHVFRSRVLMNIYFENIKHGYPHQFASF